MKPRIRQSADIRFSAYDFWLKPYGLLRVAGFLRNQAEFHLVDFLDRLDSRIPAGNYRSDRWAAARFIPSRCRIPLRRSGACPCISHRRPSKC